MVPSCMHTPSCKCYNGARCVAQFTAIHSLGFWSGLYTITLAAMGIGALVHVLLKLFQVPCGCLLRATASRLLLEAFVL